MFHANDKTFAEKLLNVLELLGVGLVLLLAFAFQIILHELPCPLCLLQRVGLFGVAFGFLLNLRFGLRPSHYAIVVLSALYTAFVALRQVALHVIPGTGAYGDAIFGMHLYTWSFIISMLIVIATTFLLGIDIQYLKTGSRRVRAPFFTHLLFAAVAILIAINVVSVFLECGLVQCPDNPMTYKLL